MASCETFRSFLRSLPTTVLFVLFYSRTTLEPRPSRMSFHHSKDARSRSQNSCDDRSHPQRSLVRQNRSHSSTREHPSSRPDTTLNPPLPSNLAIALSIFAFALSPSPSLFFLGFTPSPYATCRFPLYIPFPSLSLLLPSQYIRTLLFFALLSYCLLSFLFTVRCIVTCFMSIALVDCRLL